MDRLHDEMNAINVLQYFLENTLKVASQVETRNASFPSRG